ncbi:VOC family protein [Gordonia rubripertincta]|uniref:VOC family protein n=1 Tax=Gordonia rubripertincta TaxID=36822 RepID=UPI000B8D8E6A|nr:extradiol dioxygenase [Gordonia rubripertincta]ASR03311.1 hypothetical protein GCWB2_12570 [Gordonia rubripertincta]
MAISGAHVIIYSNDADADRAFIRDVLEYPHVDAGHGWLIFRLPPAEVALHPTEGETRHELYLMADDLEETMSKLADAGVEFDSVTDQGWGILTGFRLPGGGSIGLYQPRHPRAAEV